VLSGGRRNHYLPCRSGDPNGWRTVGDGLVLYTDGVTEAVDVQKGFYGEERLLSAVRGTAKDVEAKRLLSGIVDDVFNFAAGAEQADDITLLAFRRVR